MTTDLSTDAPYIAWDNSNVPISNLGVQGHPFYQTYTNFQQYNGNPSIGYWQPQYNANNTTTSAANTYTGEFPINMNLRYAAGYQADQNYLAFFSDKNVRWMSMVITSMLKGVHPEGKNIIIPNETIRSVCDSIFQNSPAHADVMSKMVISYIVEFVKTDYANTTKNNNLSIWVQRYDEESGLKQFNNIKLNNKQRSPYMQWRY